MSQAVGKDPLRDSHEAGCFGLVDGYAIQKLTGKRVHATDVRKSDGPFFCKDCLSDVVHRHCTEMRDHFAHHARLSPIVLQGESRLHSECKKSLYDALRARFPSTKWVCDSVRIPANKEKGIPALQPDIGGWLDGKRICIEVQSSTLTISRILKRSLAYNARGISILWVVPLKEALGDEIFRPRLFERYLHSIFFGRVYYWHADLVHKVLPVHFGMASAYIEKREWYEDGELQEAGDYERPYKRIRRPVPHPCGPIPIEDAFRHEFRDAHLPWNERKAVPAMRILLDKLKPWWASEEEEVLSRFYPPQEESI